MVSRSSSLLDALPLSPEIDMEDILNCEDPPNSDWISYEDSDQRYVKVEFATPMPPNKPKVEAPIPSEPPMSDYCRFTQIVLSMRTMKGFGVDFNVGVEQLDVSPF